MYAGAAFYFLKLIRAEDSRVRIVLIGGLAGMLPDLEHTLKREGLISQSYYPSHTGFISQPHSEFAEAFLWELGLSSLAFKYTF